MSGVEWPWLLRNGIWQGMQKTESLVPVIMLRKGESVASRAWRELLYKLDLCYTKAENQNAIRRKITFKDMTWDLLQLISEDTRQGPDAFFHIWIVVTATGGNSARQVVKARISLYYFNEVFGFY